VGRRAFDLGLIRGIGDCSTTSIWEDMWIPDRIGNKPVCKIASTTAMTVDELICDDSKSWDVEALHANLAHIDIEAILRIPLGRPTEDFWAWAAEKHGQYSV
jgi:hypothetical protein